MFGRHEVIKFTNTRRGRKTLPSGKKSLEKKGYVSKEMHVTCSRKVRKSYVARTVSSLNQAVALDRNSVPDF